MKQSQSKAKGFIVEFLGEIIHVEYHLILERSIIIGRHLDLLDFAFSFTISIFPPFFGFSWSREEGGRGKESRAEPREWNRLIWMKRLRNFHRSNPKSGAQTHVECLCMIWSCKRKHNWSSLHNLLECFLWSVRYKLLLSCCIIQNNIGLFMNRMINQLFAVIFQNKTDRYCVPVCCWWTHYAYGNVCSNY